MKNLPLKRKSKIISSWVYRFIRDIILEVFNLPITIYNSLNLKKEELILNLNWGKERYNEELLDTPIPLGSFYVMDDYHKIPTLLGNISNQMNILAGLPTTPVVEKPAKQYIYVITPLTTDFFDGLASWTDRNYIHKHRYLCYSVVDTNPNGFLTIIKASTINQDYKKTEPFIHSRHNKYLNLSPSENELDLAKMFREHPYRDPQEYLKEYKEKYG